MAVAFGTAIEPAAQTIPNGASVTNDFTFPGLTAGDGLLVCVSFNGTTTANSTAVSLAGSGNGALTSAGAQQNPEGGNKSRFWYLPSITTGGSQTLTCTFTDGTNVETVTAIGFPVTGHNVSAMTGNQAASTSTPLSLTTANANSAVIVNIQGGFSEPGTLTDYTAIDTVNAAARQWFAYDVDVGAAGAQSLSPSVGWHFHGLEINVVAVPFPNTASFPWIRA